MNLDTMSLMAYGNFTKYRRIGFTGTRKGMSRLQKETLNMLLQLTRTWTCVEFHHGDCAGADKQAFQIAQSHKHTTYAHPASGFGWRAYTASDFVYAPLPSLERNKVIVQSVQLLLATPDDYKERMRSGTWSTVRYARKIGCPLWIIFPNGRLRKEGTK